MPEVIRSALWIALGNMKNPLFSQRFDLSALHENGKSYQYVVHTQKDSEYRKEYKIEFDIVINVVYNKSNINRGKNNMQVNTGGKRNEKDLTEEQLRKVTEYAVYLGMPEGEKA